MKIIILFIIVLRLRLANCLLVFPSGTTNGYVVALSLPLGIPESNVFMSYNFEANYALPTQASFYTQGLYDKIFFINGVNRTEASSRMETINFFSRRNLYHMIEGKLNNFGYDGKACLLRLICEVAGINLVDMNGIFGSLIYILLTPTSSTDEEGMKEYIEAENSYRNCSCFVQKCTVKLLEKMLYKDEK